MQDSIIKGTGNSRYLKSVAAFLTQYPTYADFAAALAAGTLPVELNGINEEGFQQLGTALNKENLLKDTTAALYGLGTDAVPDDVFARIAKMLGGFLVKVNIQVAGVAAGAGVSVTGMTGINGEALVTDSSGSVTGLLHSKTVTITVDTSTLEEVDILQAENTFTIDTNYAAYIETTINLQPAAQGFVLVDTSKTVKFSNAVETVDLFLVGGGKGGNAAIVSDGGIANGGKGGNKTTQLAVPLGVVKNVVCVIGAGGAGGSIPSTTTTKTANGASGGDTTAVVNGSTYTAAGATAAQSSTATATLAGEYPFGSSTFGQRYGASGGRGYGTVTEVGGNDTFEGNSHPGGDDGGGDGSHTGSGGDATVAGGGGGGSLRTRYGLSSTTTRTASGGDGYKGCVVIRWGY